MSCYRFSRARLQLFSETLDAVVLALSDFFWLLESSEGVRNEV